MFSRKVRILSWATRSENAQHCLMWVYREWWVYVCFCNLIVPHLKKPAMAKAAFVVSNSFENIHHYVTVIDHVIDIDHVTVFSNWVQKILKK